MIMIAPSLIDAIKRRLGLRYCPWTTADRLPAPEAKHRAKRQAKRGDYEKASPSTMGRLRQLQMRRPDLYDDVMAGRVAAVPAYRKMCAEEKATAVALPPNGYRSLVAAWEEANAGEREAFKQYMIEWYRDTTAA